MLLLQYKTKELAFEYPFQIAKGIKTKQKSLLVSLGFERIRAYGFGELTEISYYHKSIEEMIEEIESKRVMIERYAINSPERFWHFLHHLFPGNNFLIAAFDMAGWDLWAKMNRKSVRQLLNLPAANNIKTSYTIGIHPNEKMAAILKEKQFPIYKIKLGNDQDVETLKFIRKQTDSEIRIDVNEAWDYKKAKELLPFLKEMNITLIEQPFHKEDWESLQKFQEICPIPIIADEAFVKESELERCLEHYDGINIKLAKNGGLTPALSIIKKIKTAGKKVMLGNMCESTVGSTAVAQLLSLADYVDIDGPLLFKENYGIGLTYHQAEINLPHAPSLGLRF